MTWAEFVLSDYHIPSFDGFFHEGDDQNRPVNYVSGGMYIWKDETNKALYSDVIDFDITYSYK